jgi:hypothetical protein
MMLYYVVEGPGDGTVVPDAWALVGITLESTERYKSTVTFTVNGASVKTEEVAEQWSDVKGAAGYIGCSNNHQFKNVNFFKGFLYTLHIRDTAKTAAQLLTEHGAAVAGLPDNTGATCAYNQYSDDKGVCVDCGETLDNKAGSATYAADSCTVCYTGLCT